MRNLILVLGIFAFITIFASCSNQSVGIEDIENEENNKYSFSDIDKNLISFYVNGEDASNNKIIDKIEYKNSKTNEVVSVMAIDLKFFDIDSCYSYLDDLNQDGQKELIIIVVEKVGDELYKECICFIDCSAVKQLTLSDINKQLEVCEVLEVKNEVVKLALVVDGKLKNLEITYLCRKDIDIYNISNSRYLVDEFIEFHLNSNIKLHKVTDGNMANQVNALETYKNIPFSVLKTKKNRIKNEFYILDTDKQREIISMNLNFDQIKMDYLNNKIENIVLFDEESIQVISLEYFKFFEINAVPIYEYPTGVESDEFRYYCVDLNNMERIYIFMNNIDILYLEKGVSYNKQLNYVIHDYNNDNINELILFSRRIQAFNYENIKEKYLIESPYEYISNRFTYKILNGETSVLQIYLNKELIESQKIELANEDEKIENVGARSEIVNYEFKEKSITIKLHLKTSYNRLLGSFNFEYIMDDDMFYCKEILYEVNE